MVLIKINWYNLEQGPHINHLSIYTNDRKTNQRAGLLRIGQCNAVRDILNTYQVALRRCPFDPFP